MTAAVPEIVVTGSAEVTIPATTAEFTVEVKTSAATAAAASAANAPLIRQVNDAMRAAGIQRDELIGDRLAVRPQWNYESGSRRRRAYDAVHTLSIKSDRIDQIAEFVDAALGAGATSISEVHYSSSQAQQKKRELLADAVRDGRGEAEALARAAGGTLGEPLLISTEGTGRNQAPGLYLEEVVVSAQARESVNTELIPADIHIRATVNMRYRFVSAGTQGSNP